MSISHQAHRNWLNNNCRRTKIIYIHIYIYIFAQKCQGLKKTGYLSGVKLKMWGKNERRAILNICIMHIYYNLLNFEENMTDVDL